MRKTNKAFSLIEIITATMILSLAVFGVFKMISENKKITNNHETYNTATSLFQPFKECLKKFGYNNDNKYISLNNCSSGTTKTGITINNTDFILNYSGTTNNTYDLYIITDTLKLKQKFVLK